MKLKKSPVEVVISGIGGAYPESDNILELEKNLLAKKNLVTEDTRRDVVVEDHLKEVPYQIGQLSNNSDCDLNFFGFGVKTYKAYSQYLKLSLTASTESICDAGLNPENIHGTRTAVMTVCGNSENEIGVYENSDFKQVTLLVLGQSRAIISNRLSFYFNFTGPSLAMYSPHTGAIEAMSRAQEMFDRDEVDNVIIVCANTVLCREFSFHFNRVGKLNPDGMTKSFSDEADGYSRSEALVSFFLQKKQYALRSYGSLLATANAMFLQKNSHLLDVPRGVLAPMLKQLYTNANIDPNRIGFLELSGNAAKIVDEEELNSVAEAILSRRKDKLLIGSVKSNLGHCEDASDAVAIVKALIAANSGVIAPNINYSTPNSKVPSLIEGKLEVVTDPTPLPGDIIGVNAISLVGSFSHAILKCHDKEKKIQPKVGVLPPDGLPRLFVMTGRDLTKTDQSLKKLENMPIDPEFIGLSHKLFKNGIKRHIYRGYTVLNDKGERYSEVNNFITGDPTSPVWFLYSGMGSQWPGMGKCLLKHPITASTINRCHEALKPKGVDLIGIITSEDPSIFDNILNSFVGITSIQVALTDFLKSLGLEPDGIIGHSVGELGCAYADGCLTAEEAVLCSYARGRASIETELIPGMMAAVGLGYKAILKRKDLPESIEVACHNSETSCTLSGPADDMKEYINKLTSEQVFARLVNVANIAYHSRYIRPAAPAILRYQKEFMKEPKLRSKKWLSTSVHPNNWENESAKYCSPEYFTNNLLSSVYFEESSALIPKDAVLIEIAPHGLLQAIVRRSFPNATIISLTMRNHKNGLCYLFAALGKLYMNGITLDLEKLYPPVEFPVSRGTAPLSWLLNWDHSYVTKQNIYDIYLELNMKKHEQLEQIQVKYLIHKSNGELGNLKEYQLKCKSVIPLAVHLVSIINNFKKLEKSDFIHLQNIKHYKYHAFDSDPSKLLYCLFKGTRHWQVYEQDVEGHDAMVSGEIQTALKFPSRVKKIYKSDKILGSSLYDWWKDCGLNLGPSFRLIQDFMETDEGLSVNVLWNGNLVTFLEAALLIPCIAERNISEFIPVSKILSMKLDISKFSSPENKEIHLMYSKVERVVYCDGLEIFNPTLSPVSQDHHKCLDTLQTPQFQLYNPPAVNNLNNLLILVRQIVLNNLVEDPTLHKQLHIFESSKSVLNNEIYQLFNEVLGLKQVNIKQFDEETQLENALIINAQYENVLVVTSGSTLSNSLYLLKNSKPGFLLLKGQIVPEELNVVISQEFDGHKFSLCTYKSLEDYKFISLTSKSCKKEVEDSLKCGINKNTFVVGAFTTSDKIKHAIEEFKNFENLKELRFIFHDLKSEDFHPLHHKDQLQKGLRINVLHDGKWGFVALENIKLKKIPDCLKKTYAYKFFQLRMKDSEIVAFGLDLPHTNKFTTVDFSGVINKKNICGLGMIDEKSKAIIPDPILQWEKKENWSHEDAVSSLLHYSMAYYVFNKNPYLEPKGKIVSRSILVHRGCLPLCQAIINVALHKEWEVFTTYEDEGEKKLIKKVFPQIPEDHIAKCEPSEFTTKWLLRKRSNTLFGHCDNGIDIIINTSMDRDMIYSAREMLKLDGQMFQTNFDSRTDNTTIGMEVFLKKAVIDGLFSSCILLLSDDEKNVIQREVQEGFDKGVIKPSSFIPISDQYSNLEAAALFREAKLLQNERLVVSSRKGSHPPISSAYICAPIEAHLIIVKHQSSLWIDFIEWLATRGAKKIHVALDIQLHPFTHKRLLSIMEEHPGLKIHFETECFSSRESMSLYLHSLNKTGNMQSIIILGEMNSSLLSVIGNTCPTTRVISFSQESHDGFIEKHNNCLQVIDRNFSSCYSKRLISIMDSLMNSSLREIQINDTHSNIINDLRITNLDYMLPCTIQEILAYSRFQGKSYWKEIRTKSIKAGECKGMEPVFFITPIKNGHLNVLVKNLNNPAYEAVIPHNLKDLTDVVQTLFLGLQQLSCSAYTLMCCQNNYLLGLQLGKLLEGLGKLVSIIYIDPLVEWKPDEFYQAVQNKVKLELDKSSPPRLIKKVYCGLQIFKERLNLFSQNLPESPTKFKGTFYLITLGQTLSDKYQKIISEHCEYPMEVFKAKGNSFIEMISHKDTLSLVNSQTVLDSDSKARRPPFRRTKDYYYKNTHLHPRAEDTMAELSQE